MENGELIFPSFFAPTLDNRDVKTLVYMASLNCCLFIDNDASSQIHFVHLTSGSLAKNIAFEDREFSRVIALSSDEVLLASDVDSDGPLPTQLRLSRLSRKAKVLNPDSYVYSCCIEPDFDSDTVTCIKFFPDSKKILVTRYRDYRLRRGSWLSEYDVPENIWSNEREIGKNTIQGSSTCNEVAKVEVDSNSSEKSNTEENVEVGAESTVKGKDSLDLQEEEMKEIPFDLNKDNNAFAVNFKITGIVKKSGDSDEECKVEKNCEPGYKGENAEVECEHMNAGKNSFDGHDEEGGSKSDICEEHKSGEMVEEDIEQKTRGNESDESDEEISRTRNNVTLDVYALNVMSQGYSIPPTPPESSSDSDCEFHTEEEYYDWRYGIRDVDESNLFRHNSGFYCLAISPDTTRLLTGNHDGEVFIIDKDSFDVLQHIQACEKDTVVTGCHYNPVFAHDEFATCGGDRDSSTLNIWCVENLEGGTEKASCVHSLSLESVPVNCCYSPDGKLVAVTCDSLHTYIVCPRSGAVMSTLTYEDEYPRARPGIGPTSFSVTLFAGRKCQVVTTPNHKNYSVAIWNLPVVYSLETLCLLVMRATIKYTNIDALHLPTSLKLRLKYLYV